jgi:hypothetical protein
MRNTLRYPQKLRLSLYLNNLVLRHEDVWGSRGIAQAFTSALDGGKRSVSHPGRFTPGEAPMPIEPQSRSGHGGKEKNILRLPGIEPRPFSPSLY